MSKIAEQKALEEYPTYYFFEKREGYVKGYDQAMQDFMEKAKEFFIEQHAGMFTQFKNYIQDESEN